MKTSMELEELNHPEIKPLVDKLCTLTRSKVASAVRVGCTSIDLFMRNDRASSWYGSQHKIRIVCNHSGGWALGVADGLDADEIRGLADLCTVL